jgi:hypothetical protein
MTTRRKKTLEELQLDLSFARQEFDDELRVLEIMDYTNQWDAEYCYWKKIYLNEYYPKKIEKLERQITKRQRARLLNR